MFVWWLACVFVWSCVWRGGVVVFEMVRKMLNEVFLCIC